MRTGGTAVGGAAVRPRARPRGGGSSSFDAGVDFAFGFGFGFAARTDSDVAGEGTKTGDATIGGSLLTGGTSRFPRAPSSGPLARTGGFAAGSAGWMCFAPS